MTPVLILAIAAVMALALYIAAQAARAGSGFLDADNALPGWAVAFAGAALTVTGAGFVEHLSLTARFGLQASHVGLGLILAAMTAALVQKRLWMAARITGQSSPGAILGAHYGSVTLRLVMMAMTLLFALPVAASLMSQLGDLMAGMTGGAVPRAVAIWAMSFALAVPAIVGGWRGLVLGTAILSAAFAVLLVAAAGLSEVLLPGPGFLTAGIPTGEGILPDRIPGVIQYSAGIGKGAVQGGLFTTVGIVSTALVFVGLVLSPGLLALATTVRPGRGFALSQLWLTAGLGLALLVLVLPFLAARVTGGLAPWALSLADVEVTAGAAAALVPLIAFWMTAAFLTASGAILLTRELILPYVLPGQGMAGARVTARIAIGLGFFLMAALSAFAPFTSSVLASVALPLAVQLLPAFLGLTFVRWISRGAVLAGLILGSLMVLFTEPPGLILFEGLFLDLPWGRWPLTIHSAAWGLLLNVPAVLLVAIFTRKGAERDRRDRLHNAFAGAGRTNFGGRGARGALWSLTLIWAFLALGPGAILGNTFFSQPVFTEGEAALGVPSLWVWQLLFWLIGVPLVWWLSVRVRLGETAEAALKPQAPEAEPLRAPDWIAAGLARVVGR